MPTLSGAFFLTKFLLILAVLLQSFELLIAKNSWMTIWNWSTLKNDYKKIPPWLLRVISFFLDDRGFLFALDLRIFLAILLLAFPHPLIFLGLLLTGLMISLRWRGSFNGGSDSMTTLILLALTVAIFFRHHGAIARACLWYIALQSCLSYWIAGLAKLRHTAWRNGNALALMVKKEAYAVPADLRSFLQNPSVSRIASWMILIFECSFPLALLDPAVCQFYIGLALCFHLANFFLFGLNRFVFAWMASYPALYLISFWVSGFLTLR
jgi:hypothetical protein